jgi:hypothetical protein
VQAIGGEEKLESIQTMHKSGKIIMGGLEYPFTIYQMRPNRLRIESDFQGQRFIQAYDGESGWQINPMLGSAEPREMTDAENRSFKLQADMKGLLVDYKDKGYKVDYIGAVKLDDKDAHHLKLDTQDGVVMDMYLDAKQFLVRKVTTTFATEGRTLQMETFMMDYRKVEGLVMAHTIDSRQADQILNQVVIEQVLLNVEMDEGLFEMP